MNRVDISRTILEFKTPFNIQELYGELYKKYKVELTNEKRSFIASVIDEIVDKGFLKYEEIGEDFLRYCNHTVMNYQNNRIKTPDALREEEMYYQSDFTSFEFLYLLVSLLKSLEISSLNPYDLEQFIVECKEKSLFSKVLNEFEVVGTEDDKYVLKLYNALHNCEKIKLLTLDENTTEYVIPEKFPVCYSVERVFHQKVSYIREMLLFIKEYNKYLSKNKLSIQKNK